MKPTWHPLSHRWDSTSVVDEAAIDHEREFGIVRGAGTDRVRIRVAQRIDLDLVTQPVLLRPSAPRITVADSELNAAQAVDVAQRLWRAASFARSVEGCPQCQRREAVNVPRRW